MCNLWLMKLKIWRNMYILIIKRWHCKYFVSWAWTIQRFWFAHIICWFARFVIALTLNNCILFQRRFTLRLINFVRLGTILLNCLLSSKVTMHLFWEVIWSNQLNYRLRVRLLESRLWLWFCFWQLVNCTILLLFYLSIIL